MNSAHLHVRDSQEPVGSGLQLLNELQTLLERQVELARQDNLTGVSVLTERIDAVVAEIDRLGVTQSREFQQRRRMIARLYERLSLALTTVRSDVDGEIKRIRMGRKVLGTYRRNLRRL